LIRRNLKILAESTKCRRFHLSVSISGKRPVSRDDSENAGRVSSSFSETAFDPGDLSGQRVNGLKARRAGFLFNRLLKPEEKKMNLQKIELAPIFMFLALLLLKSLVVFAQSGGAFEIKPSVISSGGGASSGGAFSLVSTVGEPLAGTVSNGASFNLTSGFWGGGSVSVTARRAPFDFDGDNKTDVSIYRPNSGEWWYFRSSDNQTRAAQFGTLSDIITPGDFTGDGKTDIAFFRPFKRLLVYPAQRRRLVLFVSFRD
jgi:hypothetical protein